MDCPFPLDQPHRVQPAILNDDVRVAEPDVGFPGNLRAALDKVYALDESEIANLYGQTRHLTRLVNDLRELYQEVILDHNRKPRNYGELSDASHHAEGVNPLCGDHIHLDLRLDVEQRVVEVGWDGEGCAISMASASMLSELIKGKTLDELRHLGKDDVLEMLGIELGPVRLKCALLSLKVLKAGAYGLTGWPGEDEAETAGGRGG